jgi:uncharacterized protein
MLKNKYFLLFLGFALATAVYYFFSSQEDFDSLTRSQMKKYKTDLLEMENSPLLSADTSKIVFFSPNPKFEIEAQFLNSNKQSDFQMAMTDSSSQPAKLAGLAKFKIENKDIEVLIFEEEGNYLLPFSDATSGQQTYGGGRYINIPKEDLLGGKLTINFNNAHNFYCSYNEKYVCPIPPVDNHIPLNILAGEKNYKHE